MKKVLLVFLSLFMIVLGSQFVCATPIRMGTVKEFMLCAGREKEVSISGKGNVNWVSSNDGVVKYVSPKDKRYKLGRIKGVKAGVAYLTAKKGSKVLARLKVTVVNHRYKNGKCIYCGLKSEKQLHNELLELKKKYPNGKTWTNKKYYGTNLSTRGVPLRGGYGCVALGLMFSDKLFGKAPFEQISKMNVGDLRVGDLVRVDNNSHTVVILSKTSAYFKVVEGNINGKIRWGTKITKSQMKRRMNYVYTRYNLMD